MAYYRRYEGGSQKDSYRPREDRWSPNEESAPEEEAYWADDEEGFIDYGKSGKGKQPCFFEDKKCKFEVPFKVIVKVVPIDEHRGCKKYYD